MTVVVHLYVKGRAACGRPLMTLASKVPSEVTCRNCQRSIHMADQEASMAVQKRSQRRRRR